MYSKHNKRNISVDITVKARSEMAGTKRKTVCFFIVNWFLGRTNLCSFQLHRLERAFHYKQKFFYKHFGQCIQKRKESRNVFAVRYLSTLCERQKLHHESFTGLRRNQAIFVRKMCRSIK